MIEFILKGLGVLFTIGATYFKLIQLKEQTKKAKYEALKAKYEAQKSKRELIENHSKLKN